MPNLSHEKRPNSQEERPTFSQASINGPPDEEKLLIKSRAKGSSQV